MTLQSSGTISLADINNEFGRGYDLNAYRGVQYWIDDADGSTGVFPSNPISLGHFYGTRSSDPVQPGNWSASQGNYNFTVPRYRSLRVRGWGGGGAGGAFLEAVNWQGHNGGGTNWNNQIFAGGGGGGAGFYRAGSSRSAGGVATSSIGGYLQNGNASPGGFSTDPGTSIAVTWAGRSTWGRGGAGVYFDDGRGNFSYGSGGGGGGYFDITFSRSNGPTPGAVVPIVVGAGGTETVPSGYSAQPGVGISGLMIIDWS